MRETKPRRLSVLLSVTYDDFGVVFREVITGFQRSRLPIVNKSCVFNKARFRSRGVAKRAAHCHLLPNNGHQGAQTAEPPAAIMTRTDKEGMPAGQRLDVSTNVFN